MGVKGVYLNGPLFTLEGGGVDSLASWGDDFKTNVTFADSIARLCERRGAMANASDNMNVMFNESHQ